MEHRIDLKEILGRRMRLRTEYRGEAVGPAWEVEGLGQGLVTLEVLVQANTMEVLWVQVPLCRY